MKWIIPGRFVKLFGRSIHCLSKIGDELYIEAMSDGLALRTVNSSRSAFGCFLFNESFFCGLTDDTSDVQDEVKDAEKFKISMKSCLGVFKSLNTIEKTVDTCRLEYDHKETRVVFKLFCKHGIVKTHNLTFQESESMQAVFSRELNPNLIVAQSKVLIDTASNFPNSCEEVTLSCSAEHLNLKNYLEDEPDPSKVVHTEMTLHPEEFDNYQIGVDTEITFCLKEARAILSFSEFVNQPINIHFSSGGKPVVFSLDGDSLYTADFVLATLMDTSMSSQASQDQDHQVAQSQNPLKAKKSFRRNQPKALVGRSKNAYAQNRQDENENDFQADETVTEDQLERPSFSTPPFNHQELDVENDSTNAAGNNQNECGEMTALNKRSAIKKDISRNVGMPCLGDSLPHEVDAVESLEANNAEVLISTPPSKKFKSIFFGIASESEDLRQRLKLHETVLAADTDDES